MTGEIITIGREEAEEFQDQDLKMAWIFLDLRFMFLYITGNKDG